MHLLIVAGAAAEAGNEADSSRSWGERWQVKAGNSIKEMKELLEHPELLLSKDNTIDIGSRREGCEALSAGHGLKAGVM